MALCMINILFYSFGKKFKNMGNVSNLVQAQFYRHALGEPKLDLMHDGSAGRVCPSSKTGKAPARQADWTLMRNLVVIFSRLNQAPESLPKF